jgi:general secretion pathway protein G
LIDVRRNPMYSIMRRREHKHARAFSLIELVIVIVIIAVIAAIAIPRLSRGSSGATDAALTENLSALRQAIDRYTAEHGNSPPTLAGIAAQLTLYSDDTGQNTQAAPDSAHANGPYLRVIPALNVGLRIGQNGIAASDGASIGWIYDATSGEIHANIPAISLVQTDQTGKLYTDY